MSKKISDSAIAFLKRMEGERLVAYQDIVGIWTIGVGHTGTVDGKPVAKGMKITAEQSEQILRQDLNEFESAVNSLVKVNLTQHQFDALVSFAFNVGKGALAKSTLLRELNAGNTAKAATEFLRWNKAGGKVSTGLTRRRQLEKAIFESAKYA